jgi:hypothetical protein
MLTFGQKIGHVLSIGPFVNLSEAKDLTKQSKKPFGRKVRSLRVTPIKALFMYCPNFCLNLGKRY